MGTFRHHTIIVTGSARDRVKRARCQARTKFKSLVWPIAHTHLNDFWSFFIAPDGGTELRD